MRRAHRLAAILLVACAAFASSGTRTVVDLQPQRRVESTTVRDPAGRSVTLTLTHLNPALDVWLLLTAQRADGVAAAYHLEVAEPPGTRLSLDAQQPGQLALVDADNVQRCVVWPETVLEQARRSMLPYAPLCDGRLYLRNAVPGNRTALERTTQFLRDHVWLGEQIVGFVRREFYADAFIQRGRPENLGIDVVAAGDMRPGQWYPARGLHGVSVSVTSPGALAGGAPALDPVERDALAFLVSFDLRDFELGFALGTEHPRLGWSARVRDDQRDARRPGPDGIGDALPLARTGMLAPALQARVVATFTGGFKREHGAFRHGSLAGVNQGSHYGFIEQGVVFSRLVPGLSTLYVLDDGTVDLKTWTTADDRLLPRIRHARQNGVPLVESGLPGRLVDQWGPGNWSGSADEKLRTLRAGACLIEAGGHRRLVYGWFSSTTPRAMAQVFRAYGCRDAMHLDMNALEHTYLAIYVRNGAQITVEHLVKGMAALDKESGGTLLPRFLAFADDRDFFYLVRRRGDR
jgi:hypothetical protein